MPAPHAPRMRLSPTEIPLVVLLAAINFTHILDFVIIMPLGKTLMTTLKIDPAQFGYLVSVYGIAAAIAGLIASTIADRFDRRATLLVAYAGFIVGTLVCGLAPNYIALLVARALTGAFGGVAASSIMAVIGDLFPDQRRGKAIGAVQASFAVATVVGLPIGLYLAEFGGWPVPFFSIAALAVAVWIVAWFRLPRVRSHIEADRPSALAQLIRVVEKPAHIGSFCFTFALVMGTFTIIPFIAPFMEFNGGRSKFDIRAIYAVAGVFTFFAMLGVGWLSDRVGKRPVFLALAGASMVFTLVITNAVPDSLGMGILLAACFMVTAAGRVVPAQAMMLWAADPKLRGAFMNLNSAVSHLATGLAPLLAGLIVTQSGEGEPLLHYDRAGYVAFGFAAIALALSFLLKAPGQKPTKPVLEEEAELAGV